MVLTVPARRHDATVVVAGHFPPPLHGSALATEIVARELGEHLRVLRLRTSPDELARSWRYHAQRVRRVSVAAVRLTLARRHTRVLFLTADAQGGLVYTLALAAVARACGYVVWVQHHSWACISRRRRLMSWVVAVLGGSATHLVSCAVMRHEFQRLYSPPVVRELSVAFTLDVPGVRHPRTATPGALRLGLLSNLRVEKGLVTVLDLVDSARREGDHLHLQLAGPAVSPSDQRIIDQAVETGTAAWSGPVTGEAFEAFFRDIDVFVLPSRHVHESFSLVVWEAMLRAVPVIAFEAGCLTQQAVGAGGRVLSADADFVRSALPILRSWVQEPDSRDRAAAEAAIRAQAMVHEAMEAFRAVLTEMRRRAVG
jgi:glycosyltransferase involved in cell wall biosynthesis